MVKKILIVDDDQPIINLLSGLSAKFFKQTEIVVAQSKEEALAVINSNKDIDIVIVQFGVTSLFSKQTVRAAGLEIVSQVKQLSAAKIIVMTSAGNMKKDFLAIGADYFINNNFDSKKISAVFSLLNQQPAP